MKAVRSLFVLFYCFLRCQTPLFAQEAKALIAISPEANATPNINCIFSIELPRATDNETVQTLNYQVPDKFNAVVQLQCFQLREKDTINVYDLLFENVKFKSGVSSTDLNFSKASIRHKNNSFCDAIRNFDLIPPGHYQTVLTIENNDTKISVKKYFYENIDSALSYNSNLRNNLNNLLGRKVPEDKISGAGKRTVQNHVSSSDAQQFNNKINGKLGKRSGISTSVETIAGKSYSCLYYSGWFLGRYEMKGSKDIKESISKEQNALKTNAASLVSNNLDGFEPVGAQMKKLNKKNKKDDDELKGNIDVSSYVSNEREPGSAQDPNYEELRGLISTKIAGLPVEIEGFYTTQDIHRRIKASYLRFHYDVDEQKNEMSGILSNYRSKFSETAAKGQGLESSGNAYLNTLTAEKSKLLYEVGKEYGINESTLKANKGSLVNTIAADTAKLHKAAGDKVKGKIDSDSTVAKENKQMEERQAKLRKKYERLQQLDKQIQKYTVLLEQFRNQNYLDSALNYSKISKLSDGDDLSYKQLAKAGEGLLPEGKVSKFVTGITHFDAGIINKYESDYTMSGQSIKGGSLGYDFNFVRVGVTAGKTEYISRDGDINQYSSYLARLNFKSVQKQKLAVIYYNYSPSKEMLKDDNFFKDKSISMPSFVNPVHILSLNHDGVITKYIRMHSEAATSYHATENTNFIGASHGAIKTSVECDIPRTTASLTGEWEHVGRNFQNSVLPYTNAGVERYTLSGNSDFFHSFLSAGLQYNYLKQTSFSTTGYSTKWGFDLSTHSRRWPSIALSYKPFATFRTYTDTLNIPQRPLTGAVCIGKASYQLKRKSMTHRFMLIYNQNASAADTEKYSSKMFQLSYILSSKLYVFNANAGWMHLPAYDQIGYVPSSSEFLSVTAGTNVNENLSISLGEEIGVAYFGFQRTSSTIGAEYLVRKRSLRLRLQTRYTNYRQDATTSAKNLIAGQLGINWEFKTNASIKKLFKNKS